MNNYNNERGKKQENTEAFPQICPTYTLGMLIKAMTSIAKAKKNLVFRATVLKTLGRVGSVIFLLLRIETSIIKTPTKKNSIFVKKSLGSAGSGRVGLPETQDIFLGLTQ